MFFSFQKKRQTLHIRHFIFINVCLHMTTSEKSIVMWQVQMLFWLQPSQRYVEMQRRHNNPKIKCNFVKCIVYHNSYLHVLMFTEKMCMWDILFPWILTEPIKQTTRWAWRKVCVTTGCMSSWPDVLTYKHIYYQLSNARISSHQWLCKCCLKKVKKEMTLHFANSWHKNKDRHLQQALAWIYDWL